MSACGYWKTACGYWKTACGYWKTPNPATVSAGQAYCCGYWRVVAGIKSKPNAYTRARTRTYVCAGIGFDTRQYPQNPQQRPDLGSLDGRLRVLALGAAVSTRKQTPQYPQTVAEAVPPNG